jgi:hypothetical protein
MVLSRRAVLAGALLAACKTKQRIDPDIAAWLGEPGDAPTPKLFAKLSGKSMPDDVKRAFPAVEKLWDSGFTRARTSAAPGLEWIEFQFERHADLSVAGLSCVTVVYAQAASTPELWTKLLTALTARYGKAKNEDGSIFAPARLAMVTAYKASGPYDIHRVKFFL